MKKLIFVVTSMSKGGAERVVSVLANHYAKVGCDVKIVMLWHDICEYTLHPDIELINMSNDKCNSLLRAPYLVLKLRQYIKTYKPDSVISFIAQNCIVTFLANIGLSNKLISSERIDPSVMKRNFIFQKILNIVYSKSDVTVLQTERAKNFFPKKVQLKSMIIGNPIEVDEHCTYAFEKEIVTVGRLAEQKNHLLLIDSFSEIHKNFPDYKLTIYGEGIMREKLVNHIKDLELEDFIKLPGVSDNIHHSIKNSSMFVLSSNFEGLSNALLEAMVMGIPCISTKCSGSDEVIINKINGILVSINNKDELIEAMECIIKDKKFAKTIGEKAKETTEKFKTENILKKWDKVILDE